LQHVPFEGLGSIQDWLVETGYEITRTRFYHSAELPSPEGIDLLIVMGGPMSVNDENGYPWLAAEKGFIKKFIASGKPALGICLGAQLIASALGGKVFPNPVKEIGWFSVKAVASAADAAFVFPESTEAFHWHGETFSLPSQAIRTAESEGCRNQAFQIGTGVIGLQFHLETTPESARALVNNCGNELVAGKYIQTAEFILSAPPERYAAINSLMRDVLEYLHQRNG